MGPDTNGTLSPGATVAPAWDSHVVPIQPSRHDWKMCHDVARVHGRTFFFASHLLPPAQRRAILAAYAYCRIADDLVDRAPAMGVAETARRLDAWESELEFPCHPVAVAFAAARATYGIPAEPAHDLLRGIRLDLTPARYRNWDDLQHYCYLVAGTIGLIAAPVLGCRDDSALPHAVDLGIAMQLTNILRDVGEDAELGRIYLPAEDLIRFGVDPEALSQGRATGDFAGLIAFEIARARELYDSAKAGIPALSPFGQMTALASAHLYSGILREIEANDYDVLRRRAYVPMSRKLASMPSVGRSFLRLQLQVF